MADTDDQLTSKIATILTESTASYATHNRKLKELSSLRSPSSDADFFSSFCKALAPIFSFHRRTPPAERAVRFVTTFAASHNSHHFLEGFLRFLLPAASASSKDARSRGCQIISEVIYCSYFVIL